MRLLSPQFIRAMYGEQTGEVILPLVQLSHASWTDDIRLVPNTEPITHQTQEFMPYAFDITLPDDTDEGLPVLKWVADNVSLELIAPLRTAQNHIDVWIAYVLASTPDNIELGPYNLELNGVQYDAQTLSGTMTIEPILDAPFCSERFTPADFPGLF